MPKNILSPALVFALFGFLLSPPIIFAQTSPYVTDQATAEDEETVVLPTFTVESETVDRYRAADAVSAVRIRTSLIETPSTISVLTREFLEDVAPARILDAARYSASVQSQAGRGTAETMTMRGFGTAWKTIDNYLDYSGYLMEPALIERIEISKGPNAILAPGITPGGHVNIITKAPQFERSSSVEGLFGEWDADKFTLDTTGPVDDTGRFAYRLVGVLQDTRRYWSKDHERTRKAIAPSFTWRINPTTELTLRYYYFNTAESRGPNGIIDSSVTLRGQKPVLAPGFSYRGMNGAPKWSISSYDGGTASAQFKTSFNKHVTMRLAAFAHRAGSVSDTASPALPGLSSRYNPYDGILTPNQTWALQDDTLPYDAVTNRYVSTAAPYYDTSNLQLRGNRGSHWRKTRVVQNDWVLNFEIPFAKLQTVAGWVYTDDAYMFRNYLGSMTPYSIFDLDNQDTSVTWSSAVNDDHTDEEDTTQLFINQRVSFWEDRISITGGYLWYERMNDVQDDFRNTHSHTRESTGMYMASALYRVTPHASVYYSYSTNAVPSTGNGVAMWREGKQNEYGVKTEFFNRRLSLNLAYFEIEENNIAVPNPDFDAGDFTLPRQLITAQDNHGIEIELNGALTRNLSAMASFSHIKMSDVYGRDVLYVSKNLAGLLLSYRLHEGAFSGFSATFGAVYTGEFAGDTPAIGLTPLGIVAQPSFYIPSHTLVNAGLGYDLGRFQVRLYVDNVLDKRDYIQYGGSRSGVSSGEGRLFKASATVKF